MAGNLKAVKSAEAETKKALANARTKLLEAEKSIRKQIEENPEKALKIVQSETKKALDEAKKKLTEAEKKVKNQIKENPEKAVITAAVIGAAIGALLTMVATKKKK